MITLSLLATATSISVGTSHTCALLADQTVKCWGSASSGQLGQEDTRQRGSTAGSMGNNLPRVNLGTGLKVRMLVSGDLHNCILSTDSKIKCWGRGNSGQLGLEDSRDRGRAAGDMGDALPTVNLGANITPLSVHAGGNSTCAIVFDGSSSLRRLKCWGDNSSGQLGLETSVSLGRSAGQMGEALPFVDLGDTAPIADVSISGTHACALFEDGRLKCWGAAERGGLGLGTTNNSGKEPKTMGNYLPFVPLREPIKQIRVTNYVTCGVTRSGQALCWGYNGNGQLGQEDTVERGLTPETVPSEIPYIHLGETTEVQSIFMPSNQAGVCVTLLGGTFKCWGALGVRGGTGENVIKGATPNTMGDRLPYSFIGRRVSIEQLALGGSHSCAKMTDGSVKCWGSNFNGAVGSESTSNIGMDLNSIGDKIPFVKF